MEEGLPELLSKARGEARRAQDHKHTAPPRPLSHTRSACPPAVSVQVDTFQSDVAAISAGLRQPVGGAQGGAPAAGLATRKGFEPSLAPAGAASRPADRQRAGLASRTAVKPSSSWRLGDVAPLAVGEPLDDGAAHHSAPPRAFLSRPCLPPQAWSPGCRPRRRRRSGRLCPQPAACLGAMAVLQPCSSPAPRGVLVTPSPARTVCTARLPQRRQSTRRCTTRAGP